MKYEKKFYDEEEWKEITYEEALDTLLTTFLDNEMTRSMLTIPNWITCRCSVVQVSDHGMVAQAGLENLVPDEFWEEHWEEYRSAELD